MLQNISQNLRQNSCERLLLVSVRTGLVWPAAISTLYYSSLEQFFIFFQEIKKSIKCFQLLTQIDWILSQLLTQIDWIFSQLLTQIDWILSQLLTQIDWILSLHLK